MEDVKVVSHSSSDEKASSREEKRSNAGIVLIPQPSDDPRDPLNWSLTKKTLNLSIISFASLVGIAQALANQAGFFVQAAVYHKTPTQLSYSIAAAIVGLATGPVLIWAPLSRKIGRPSCIFWGMLATLFMNVWSTQMTGEDDYIPFVISKWLGGTFGSVASAIGAGTLIDTFFLHQRGKAFACYTIATLFGTQFGGTFSGFIVNSVQWPAQFYWCIGAEALVVVLVFVFLEETGYAREAKNDFESQQSWATNRVATFLPGNRVAPPHSVYTASPMSSVLIGLCPVTVLAGLFLCIAFGWTVALTTLLSVFLQSPVEEGGYAFTPTQNAAFTFCSWIGIIVAEIYSMLLNDRIPLWRCQRNGGIWKPEYRLFPLIIPQFIILPVGLGIFGAGLQYHLHYMVLALGVFLVNFSEISLVPVIFNYVAESFTGFAAETTTIMNFYRLILGILVPFFINPWEAAVGSGWVFGMMAFFTIFAFSFTFLLAWKGPAIRELSFSRFKNSEEGEALLKGVGIV